MPDRRSIIVAVAVAVCCVAVTRAEDNPEDTPMKLHPDYPVVEGRYQMTKEWSVELPTKFNRRVEDGSLIIWKPGFTILIDVLGNDNDESAADRLKAIREDSSPDAFDSKTESQDGVLRYSYRLKEESDDLRQPAFYGFAIGDSGHVQMAIYVNEAEDIDEATKVWRSLLETKQ